MESKPARPSSQPWRKSEGRECVSTRASTAAVARQIRTVGGSQQGFKRTSSLSWPGLPCRPAGLYRFRWSESNRVLCRGGWLRLPPLAEAIRQQTVLTRLEIVVCGGWGPPRCSGVQHPCQPQIKELQYSLSSGVKSDLLSSILRYFQLI